jgi:hypothetical protein
LKSHPDIGLDVLHQMANVDVAVGVGQGGGNKKSAHEIDGVPAEFRAFLIVRF